jgi:hypothetical protein
MRPEPGEPADELVEWAEVLGGAMLGGRSDLKPVEEALPELAARLNLITRRALEQAPGTVAPLALPRLLWAPGRAGLFPGRLERERDRRHTWIFGGSHIQRDIFIRGSLPRLLIRLPLFPCCAGSLRVARGYRSDERRDLIVVRIAQDPWTACNSTAVPIDCGVTRHAQHECKRAPGRNRTYDTRFRKPVLYPLSYEGGACVKRGRKPVAELRSSFGTSILAAGPGRPAGCLGLRAPSGSCGPLGGVLRPLRAMRRSAAQAAEARRFRCRCSWSASELTMMAYPSRFTCWRACPTLWARLRYSVSSRPRLMDSESDRRL